MSDRSTLERREFFRTATGAVLAAGPVGLLTVAGPNTVQGAEPAGQAAEQDKPYTRKDKEAGARASIPWPRKVRPWTSRPGIGEN